MSEQNTTTAQTQTQDTTQAAGTQAAPVQTQTDWTTGFNDELKGYVATKGFKDTAAVLNSYQNLEKLIGHPQEKILKLPDNMEDPKALADIYNRLGRPADKEGYKLQAPEGGDKEFTEWAKGTFHEAGLTSKQAHALFQKYNEHVGNLTKAQSESYQADIAKQETALKTEWGAAFEQKVNSAKRAAKEFGVSAEAIDKLEKSMGFTGVMKFFDQIGSKLGEGSYINGDSNTGGSLTPEAARGKLKLLIKDADFQRRIANKDAAALMEWNNLNQMASPQ